MSLIHFASVSIFVRAYSGSDFFGKLIFIGLFALSFVSWYTVLQKLTLMKKVRLSAKALSSAIVKHKEQVLNLSSDQLLLSESKEIPNPFAKIYFSLRTKTIELLDKNRYFVSQEGKETDMHFLSRSDVDLVETHMQTAIAAEGRILHQNLFILSTVVSLAPFLGILGTVWGILMSLGEMQSGSGYSTSVVLSGLSTALATTVLGLVIAIPALISYNYLKNALNSFLSEMYDFSDLLLSTVELQYRKVDIT